MKKLTEIIGFNGEILHTREAVRAVLFREDRRIPILYVARYGYHKLPGGGVDAGENHIEALFREISEEVGDQSILEIDGGAFGYVVEHKLEHKEEEKPPTRQTSYCYRGTIQPGGETHFTEKEELNEFELKWMTLSEAIEALTADKPSFWEGQMILERDLAFLHEVKQVLGED